MASGLSSPVFTFSSNRSPMLRGMKTTSASRHLGRLATLTFLLAFTGGLLTACGGSTAGTPGAAPTVASVPTPAGDSAAKPSNDAVSVDDSRPLDRPDTTAEEQDRMYLAFWNCLTSHGIPKVPVANSHKPMDDGRAAYAPARKACAAKEPEDYKDRLQRHEPEKYLDNIRKQIKCVQDKGFKITTGPANDPEIGFPDKSQVPRGLDAVSECEEKYFGTE
jgi:hypothetical protein